MPGISVSEDNLVSAKPSCKVGLQNSCYLSASILWIKSYNLYSDV